jgi:AraC-like DNA-binding protein
MIGHVTAPSLQDGLRAHIQAGGGPTSAGSLHAVQLARATSFIEQNLGSHELTPKAVADAIHVSRSTLYRLFGGSGGVSRYIWQARLERAWSVLSSSDEARQIGEIAFDLGFLSEAHFCHAFRNAFGISPGSLRQGGVVKG